MKRARSRILFPIVTYGLALFASLPPAALAQGECDPRATVSLTAQGSVPTVADASAIPAGAELAALGEVSRRLVDLANQERAAKGLRPLVDLSVVPGDCLGRAILETAHLVTEEMAQKNQFFSSHVSPTYGNPMSRFIHVHRKVYHGQAPASGGIGENLFNATFARAPDAESMAAQAHQALMNSWMHRLAILWPEAQRLSVSTIARKRADGGIDWWVAQIFHKD